MIASWFENMVPGFAFLCLTSLMFAGCSDLTPLSGEEEAIRFAGMTCDLMTRTSMSGETATFTSGDKVGIFEVLTGRNNVLFNYGSPSWTTTTPMYWLNSVSQHQFYAYYPYNSSANGSKTTLPVLAGQQISGVPDPLCDLLAASLSQRKSSSVSLSFTHSFALLKFNISLVGSLLGSLSSAKMTVAGGNSTGTGCWGMFNTVNDITKISYDLPTRQLAYSPNNNTVFQQSVAATLPGLVSGTTTVYVIVLPGAYAVPAPYVQFSLKLIGLLELSSANISLQVTNFQPNTKYEYNVQISRLLGTKSGVFPDSLQVSVVQGGVGH